MSADRYLDHAGASLRWRLEGTGPALVLLHGWALDLGIWDAVAARLARNFTVLRFDRRGFGLSSGIPDIHRNAEDLQTLLDAAGIDAAAVLGMSQGARLALHFALRCPERVTALVLDGAPAIEAESELPLDLYRKLLQTEGLDALRQQIMAHPLMQLHTQDHSAHAVLLDSVGHYRGLDLLHPATRAHAPDLRRIECPVMLLNGSLDSAARRDAAMQLRSALGGAAQVRLAEAGHLALLDVPEAYAKAVTGYLLNTPVA